MRGGELSLADAYANPVGSDRVMDWAKICERRWGDELWLEPAEGLDEEMCIRDSAGRVSAG